MKRGITATTACLFHFSPLLSALQGSAYACRQLTFGVVWWLLASKRWWNECSINSFYKQNIWFLTFICNCNKLGSCSDAPPCMCALCVSLSSPLPTDRTSIYVMSPDESSSNIRVDWVMGNLCQRHGGTFPLWKVGLTQRWWYRPSRLQWHSLEWTLWLQWQFNGPK